MWKVDGNATNISRPGLPFFFCQILAKRNLFLFYFFLETRKLQCINYKPIKGTEKFQAHHITHTYYTEFGKWCR